MTDTSEKLIYLGRELGLFGGWDGDIDYLIFYQFRPHESVGDRIPAGDLNIDSRTGIFQITAEGDENPLFTGDAVTVLSWFPKGAL